MSGSLLSTKIQLPEVCFVFSIFGQGSRLRRRSLKELELELKAFLGLREHSGSAW